MEEDAKRDEQEAAREAEAASSGVSHEAPELRPHVEREERGGGAALRWAVGAAGVAGAVAFLALSGVKLPMRSAEAVQPAQAIEAPVLPMPERAPSPKPAAEAVPLRAAAPALAELTSQQNVQGTWTGRYYYPSGQQPPVHFNITFMQIGDRLTGQISEPNTFGGAGAPFLQADLEGTVTNGVVTFNKRYDGTGGVGHGVQYSGRLSPDGRSVSGTWMITGNWSGAFEMRR